MKKKTFLRRKKKKCQGVILLVLSVVFMLLGVFGKITPLLLIGVIIMVLSVYMIEDNEEMKNDYIYDLFCVMLVLPSLIALLIFLFKESKLWIANIHLDNWVNIFGSLLTYFGTITLGLVSIRQNDRLNNVNKRLAQFQMEEYTPFLQITSFAETMPNSKRLPDTTQSVLFGSSEYMPSNIEKRFESELTNRLKSLNDDFKNFTPEKKEAFQNFEFDFAKELKKIPSVVIERHSEIYWIIKKDNEAPQKSFSSLDLLEKKTFKMILTNNTKAKIKKVILREILMENSDQKWKFTPDKLHDSINYIIMPQMPINFNLNLYWEKDPKLTILMETAITKITIKFRLITIGNIEENEELTASIWIGKVIESSYNLVEDHTNVQND